MSDSGNIKITSVVLDHSSSNSVRCSSDGFIIKKCAFISFICKIIIYLQNCSIPISEIEFIFLSKISWAVRNVWN